MDGDIRHLVSFFAVCGVESLHELDHEGDEVSPVEAAYKPKILCHFPKERRGVEFNSDAALTLSLPFGARFYTDSKVPSAPSFHSFVITDEIGVRAYGVSLRFYQRVTNEQLLDELASRQAEFKARNPKSSSVWERGDPLLGTKTLLLILGGPYVSFGQQVLEQLLTCGVGDCGGHLVSQHLHCLLHNVFLPAPGRMVEYEGPFGSVFCRVGAENGLPDIDFPFRLLMETFSVNDILCIFKGLLLESRFLLVSKDLHLIVAVAELLCVLLFPLHWDHVFAPIVPLTRGGDLYDAPCAYIMGARLDCKSPAREDLPIEVSDEVCVVNIDFGHVDILEHMDVPLPKAGLLMAGLKEKLKSYGVSSPLQARLSPEERPITTSGLASVCENIDMFRRDMQVCRDLDRPVPSVRVHNRFVLKRGSSCSGLPSEQSLVSSPQNTSPAASSRTSAKARLARIAQEAGISLPMNLSPTGSPALPRRKLSGDEETNQNMTPLERLQASWMGFEEAYSDQQTFNHAIQQVFLDYFVQLLHNYNIYSYESNEDLILFDKVAFLSDQPANLLSFFDLFLETAIFNRLLEYKGSERYAQLPPSISFFNSCLKDAPTDVHRRTGNDSAKTRRRGVSHTLRFEEFQQAQAPTIRRLSESGELDLEESLFDRLHFRTSCGENGTYGKSNGVITGHAHTTLLGVSPNGGGGGIGIDSVSPVPPGPNSRPTSATPENGQDAGADSPHTPDAPVLIPRAMLTTRPGDALPNSATSQATFVRRLLRDCRMKVKRLLVSKMGREALLLGHADHTGVSSEDNTLITSLCDVLERVWTHGSQQRKVSVTQGKSHMWTHLEAYYEEQKGLVEDVIAALDDEQVVPVRHRVSLQEGDPFEASSLLSNGDSPRRSSPQLSPGPGILGGSGMHRSPSVGDLANNVKAFASGLRRDRSRAAGKMEARLTNEKVANRIRLLRACNTGPAHVRHTVALLNDIRSVKDVAAIKTNIGFARAFVRLSLEKKWLSNHITQLLSDRMVLQDAYRDYAFLRCDDELEQFRFHLLSLTTVDMFCFSTRYLQTVVEYSVVLLPGAVGLRSQPKGGSVQLFGSNGMSEPIRVSESADSLSVELTNLGIIESMIIRFPGVSVVNRYHRIFVVSSMTDACNEMCLDSWTRSEDNCFEMLFVAKRVSAGVVLDANTSLRRVSGGPPSSLTITQPEDVAWLRENVASCVNRFAKYMDRALPQSQTLTALIWGEDGLCFHLQEVFAHGLKVSRVLRSKRPVWDFIEKVCTSPTQHVPASLTAAFATVDRKCTVCKSVKFFQLVCFGIRCQELSGWANVFFKSDIRQKMYQPWALILDAELSFHVLAVLGWLCGLDLRLPLAVEKFIGN